MPETPSPVEVGLARFSAPDLSTLRPMLVDRWKDGFADLMLASDILANPRMQPRIASDICLRLKQPAQVDVPTDVDQNTIAAIMTHGEYKLAELAGCLWYRATVLEWMTWNDLAAHLPDVDLSALRTCLRKIPVHLTDAAGAPAKPVKALEHSAVLDAGRASLSAWIKTAPALVATRMDLFVTPFNGTANAGSADLIPALSAALMEAPKP